MQANIKQEGWLSPTERASVSAISLRHIIWLPHESHAGIMSLPTGYSRFAVAASGIWLRQESLRHILASFGYTPGTIVVNITWMERGFSACQTHRSMYPSVFNRFAVIQPVNLKIRDFSLFFAHLASPGYAHGTIAVNVTWIEREFNAGHAGGDPVGISRRS